MKDINRTVTTDASKMVAPTDPTVSKQLYKVMDALAALTIDLHCEPHIPDETLVISAAKSRDACEALDSASDTIKELMAKFGAKATGGRPEH